MGMALKKGAPEQGHLKRGVQKGGTKKGGRPGLNTTQMDAKYHQFYSYPVQSSPVLSF